MEAAASASLAQEPSRSRLGLDDVAARVAPRSGLFAFVHYTSLRERGYPQSMARCGLPLCQAVMNDAADPVILGPSGAVCCDCRSVREDTLGVRARLAHCGALCSFAVREEVHDGATMRRFRVRAGSG